MSGNSLTQPETFKRALSTCTCIIQLFLLLHNLVNVPETFKRALTTCTCIIQLFLLLHSLVNVPETFKRALTTCTCTCTYMYMYNLVTCFFSFYTAYSKCGAESSSNKTVSTSTCNYNCM